MHVEMDPDLQAVTSFMQKSFSADRLAPLADELFRIAPLLWGHFDRAEVRALSLRNEPIVPDGSRRRRASSESCPAR